MIVNAAGGRIPGQPAHLPLDDDIKLHLPESDPAVVAYRKFVRIPGVYREGVDKVFFLSCGTDETFFVINRMIGVHIFLVNYVLVLRTGLLFVFYFF
jgi:hypothetical protein